MNKHSSFSLSAYVINVPHLLKGPAITCLCLLVVLAVLGAFAGENAPAYGKVGIYLIPICLCISFLMKFVPTTSTYRCCMGMLKASGDLENAVLELEKAKQVIGIGAVGPHFYFGCGTGVVLKLENVSRVIHHVRIYTDSDGDKQRKESIQFVLKGGSRLPLCTLPDKNAYAVLSLLYSKCTIASDLLTMFGMAPQPDKAQS